MMKSNDLQGALTRMQTKAVLPPVKEREEKSPEPLAAKPVPQYRKGKIQIAGFFEPHVSFQLRDLETQLSKEKGERVTRQDVLALALNLLFEAHGLSRIA